MRRPPIILAGVSFPFKKDLLAHTRQLITSLGTGQVPAEHQPFFTSLLERHPRAARKIGDGVRTFHIGHNPLNPSALQMHLTRTDDTVVEFSWIGCCTQIVPSATVRLHQAMRCAVAEQTSAFKRHADLECVECAAIHLPPARFHVDHKTRPFHAIRDAFLSSTSLAPPEEFSRGAANTCVFNSASYEYERAWAEFHREHADFQILCAACNMRKGGRSGDGDPPATTA